MLRLASYDVVFAEVPGEVTLALNLSECPHRCPGCHSPHLQGVQGEELDGALLDGLLSRYAGAVTCVCVMGGDNDPGAVGRVAKRVREHNLRTGWYSGCATLPAAIDPRDFDYIKLGPYKEALGGLGDPATNQRFYRVENGALKDCTAQFIKTGNPG